MTAGGVVTAVAPGDVVCRRGFAVDQVDLFLFSAACWLPHRIHFDREFARSEGLPDTPVHGPLQAAWLCQLAEEWAVELGGHLVASNLRHLVPVYPGDDLTGLVTVTAVTAVTDDGAASAVDVELCLERSGGERVTAGTGRIRVARTGTP